MKVIDREVHDAVVDDLKYANEIISELYRRISTLQEPNMFWVKDCGEEGPNDLEGISTCHGCSEFPEEVFECSTARSTGNMFVALKCTKINECGSCEKEIAVFTNHFEAEKCWRESYAEQEKKFGI